MSGNDLEVEACAMGGRRDDAGEGLVRDGTDIDHGQIVCSEGGVQYVESDATLRDSILFLGIDLLKQRRCEQMDVISDAWREPR